MTKFKVVYAIDDHNVKDTLNKLVEKPYLYFNVNSKMTKLSLGYEIEFDYDINSNKNIFDFRMCLYDTTEQCIGERKERDGELIRKIKEYKTLSGYVTHEISVTFDKIYEKTMRGQKLISETSQDLLSYERTNTITDGDEKIIKNLSELKFYVSIDAQKKDSSYVIRVAHFHPDPDPGYY